MTHGGKLTVAVAFSVISTWWSSSSSPKFFSCDFPLERKANLSSQVLKRWLKKEMGIIRMCTEEDLVGGCRNLFPSTALSTSSSLVGSLADEGG
jgi:hypothetical protein